MRFGHMAPEVKQIKHIVCSQDQVIAQCRRIKFYYNKHVVPGILYFIG